MKKLLLSIAMLGALSFQGQAQLSKGGLPLSLRTPEGKETIVPVNKATLPDWNTELAKWDADQSSSSKPFLLSLFTPTNIDFTNSGILYTAANGSRIWKAKLTIPGAPAIGLYYDQFNLPEGVQLYISNENGKQMLGAYTSSNNSTENLFANEPVQGSTVNMELNIEPSVDLSTIKLHINRAAVYFRGIENLAPYGSNFETIDQFDSQLAGSSSVCNYNAICPLGNGYANQRDAALHVICVMPIGTGTCSATMLNSAGNTTASCKQYLLFASHCEFTNGTTNSAFAQYIFRFKYQHSVCTPAAGTIPNTQTSITGANFVSRSIVPLLTSGPNAGQPDATKIKGDFILLEFTGQNKIPASWNVNLAGWDNDANTAQQYNQPKKFIGFHHPAGDVKKVSSGQSMQSYAIGSPNSHWLIQLDSGYAAQGSSGSGLFNGEGRVIGVASVAAPGQGVPASCMTTAKGGTDESTAKIVLYSKLSNVWDYSVDGNNNTSKLKPWLDPAGSNVKTLNIVKSDCSPVSTTPTGIHIDQDKLDQSISVYPTPSYTGNVQVRFNLAETTDLQMELYDVSGRKIKDYTLQKVREGAYTLNLSAYPAGMYLLKISNGTQVSSKKIMLQK